MLFYLYFILQLSEFNRREFRDEALKMEKKGKESDTKNFSLAVFY